MKRSEIKRSTPLKPGKPLQRKSALSSAPFSASAKHRNSASNQRQPKRTTASPPPRVPAKVRAALAARSEGLCEIAQQGCTRWATEFSHRKKLGIGGRKGAARAAHDVLSNAVAGCHNCHQVRGHANPRAAYDMGWMLKEHQNPLAIPLLYRGSWKFLTDDGRVLTDPDFAEEATR